MKYYCCILLIIVLAPLCFAQDIPVWDSPAFAAPVFRFQLEDNSDFSPYLYRPMQMAVESDQNIQSQSIFANSPLWVKDLRRGEIVFFGTLPFTVLFSRTFVDLFRMGMNNWDRRYAPWPFQSAGGVMMNTGELILTYSIAASVSVVIAIIDHLIVRHKRKSAAVLDE